ncbi:unnamed protein product [Closterium sp. Yama58-4]|nr:unnamed protein product [Closterium sp. Yama58-4]
MPLLLSPYRTSLGVPGAAAAIRHGARAAGDQHSLLRWPSPSRVCTCRFSSPPTELASEFLGQLLPFAMGHVPLEANTLDVKMPARDDTMALTLKAWSDRDVVVWFKTTWERVQFHPRTDDIALPMLPYQKSLHAMAERLLAHLPRPLIAVHFRSEFIAFRVQEDMVSQGGKANASMVQQRLDWCVGESERLIISVRDSLSHPSTVGNSTTAPNTTALSTTSSSGPSVFIAADVPFNESAAPARSDSWTEMVQWYDGDSRVLQSSSAALHRLRRNVHGTVMIDEIMPQVNELDPGVVAILDKLVCAHADVFLAGSWACGGGRGYETDIMKHRRQVGYSDDTLKRWAEEHGYEADIIEGSGYEADIIEGSGYEADIIEGSGYEADIIEGSGYEADIIEGSGYEADIIEGSGYEADIIEGSGYEADIIEGSGYEADIIEGSGYEADIIEGSGYEADIIEGSGYEVDIIEGSGYEANIIEGSGYEADIIEGSGYEADIIEGSGYEADIIEAPPAVHHSRDTLRRWAHAQ